MLLRLSTLATRPHRRAPADRRRPTRAMLNAGITPVVHEYGSLGCSGDLAPLAHCALAAMGEGTVARCAAATRGPAADALAAAGITAARARARRRAWRSSTAPTACSACWCSPPHDLRPAAAHRRHHRRDERRGAARHRRGVRRRPAGAAPAPRAGRERGQPARAARRLGDHGQPPRPGLHPRAGRLLAALLPAGARRGPRHARPRRAGRATASWPAPSTTRS